MKKWAKKTAVKELELLLKQIGFLEIRKRLSEDHIYWATKTLEFLEEVFGVELRYYLTFSQLSWSQMGTVMVGGPADMEGSFDPQTAIEKKHQKAYVRDLGIAKGILRAALDKLMVSDIDDVYEGKNTPQESSLIFKTINLAERKLRKMFKIKPSNEKDVQDEYEKLLMANDIPYSREADKIEYSSKTYIPDFTIKKINLAVEIKYCSKEGREKVIIAEINDDILAYKKAFANIFFVVYDSGYIRDIDKFVSSFEENPNVIVKVIKH